MDYTVAAVDKALDLLFLVAQFPGLGVTEIARRSCNTKARAFRLLSTLEQRGMVQRQPGSATYILGSRTLYIGAAAQEQVDLVRLADHYLRDIGRECNENVTVRVREGLETVCVARWESSHAVRVNTQVGTRRPLHASASGKLLLAYAPPEVQRAVLAGKLPRFTSNTIVDPDRLAKELASARARGYTTSFGEVSNDAVAIAAPIRDVGGSVVAALGIAGPSSRITRKNVRRYVRIAIRGAGEYSRGIGYAGSAAR